MVRRAAIVQLELAKMPPVPKRPSSWRRFVERISRFAAGGLTSSRKPVTPEFEETVAWWSACGHMENAFSGKRWPEPVVSSVPTRSVGGEGEWDSRLQIPDPVQRRG